MISDSQNDSVNEVASMMADGTFDIQKATDFLNKEFPIGHSERAMMSSVLSVAVSVCEMVKSSAFTTREIYFLSKVENRFSQHTHCPICIKIAYICGEVVRNEAISKKWIG